MSSIRKTCLALLAVVVCMPLCTFAQITVSARKTAIRSVIQQIERTSEYRFFYNSSLPDLDRKVDIEVKDATIGTTLEKLFGGTAIAYTVSNFQISLAAKKEEAPKNLSGVVTSDQGEKLVGVTVIVKGTGKACATNVEGRFAFNEPLADATLIVQSIGYKTREVPVQGRTSLDITLQEESLQLDDVVVIGYGTLEKRELTSSVTSLKSSDLLAGNTASPLQAIAGKVPGLNIVSESGTDPNGSVSIQLRGANSINADQGPLIVVDGIPGGNMNILQKEDIVSIDVLKDASAGAIYGTRASGGVILVTTRMGQIGKPVVSYTGEFTTETVRKKAEVLSTDEWLAHGQTDRGGRTNWFDAITRTPFTQRHIVTMSGGTKNFAAYASLFYKNAQGMTIRSDKREIGGRFNFKYTTLNDRLELSGRLNYVDSKSNIAPSSIFRDALNLNPTIPVYNPKDPSGYTILEGEGEWNPVAVLQLSEKTNNIARLQADISAKLNIYDGLSTTLTVGTVAQSGNEAYWESALHRRSREMARNGYAEQKWHKQSTESLEWIFNYNKLFGAHSIKAVAGYSYQRLGCKETFEGSNADFSIDGAKWYDMGEGTWLKKGQSSINSHKNPKETLVAYFGRVNYSYADRYLVSVSARYEGSSKFGVNNRYGWFPAVSAAWRISNESFLRNVNWLNDLRLRFGYGRTGNAGFDPGVTTRMYKPDTSSSIVRAWYFNGGWSSVYGLARNVNPDLQWETKDEYNFGLDFEVLDRRLGGKLDVYKRKVDNMIYNISVSQPPAVYDKTTMNVGSMQNTGFEIELTGVPVQTKDWNYTTSFRLARNKTRLITLWGSQTTFDDYDFPTPGSPGKAVRLAPGEDIGQFYIWKYAGIADDGSWLLYDKDNNIIPASQKTPDDKRFIGQATPDVILSWDNSITWKNFDLSLFFRSWIGNDVFNMTEMYHGLQSASGQNTRNRLKSAFGRNAKITGEKELCDYFLEDGSFLKLDAATLGYTLRIPSIKSYVKSIRFTFTARNVFCLTKYRGIDPEVNINGLTPGFEGLEVWPATRVFTLGITINL